MSYCPNCYHEYAESVTTCIDCNSKLLAGNRPVSTSLGLDDSLIPVGAAVCGLIALLLLLIRVGAGSRWFSESVATFIFSVEPPWMVVLYGLALLTCCVTLAITGIQSRRGRR